MQFPESWLRCFVDPLLSTDQLAHALTMAGLEVETLRPALNDSIFTLKLTPNRADCLSVLGIAREVAALTSAPLTVPPFKSVPVTLDDKLPIRISAPDLCGRFSGRVIRNLNARAQTPGWMVERLEGAGQRSVSALVDISNYLMLEFGGPSHIFDLDKLHDGLEVRWGRRGESLKLLNGNTVNLDETVGIIADGQGGASLAGIMGGDNTAVSLDTRHIYLEAAFWWPSSIRGRARRYHFSTEAAHRFERGVDYASTVDCLERLTKLIIEICGGEVGPIDDHVVNLPQRAQVTMRVARAKRVIGVALDAEEIAQIFMRLALPFQRDGDTFTVSPPSYRFDLEIEEDLIEEVSRLHGFDKIPARPPVAPNQMRATDETRCSIHAIRHALVARDYTETVNFSFVDAAWERDLMGNHTPLRLLNPIANHLSVMRSTLFGSLISALRYNLNRHAERVRLFEVGPVFRADATVGEGEWTVAGLAQSTQVGALAYGPVWEEQWGAVTRLVDFFDVKNDLETLLALTKMYVRYVKAEHPALHPARSARIELEGRAVGFIGELHPRWRQQYDLPRAPVLFEIDAETLARRALPVTAEVPKFPSVQRDIAIVVPQEIAVQTLLDEICAVRAEYACRYIQNVMLFDEFQPKADPETSQLGGLLASEKSLAFRLTLQDTGGTLQDETIDLAIRTVVDRLTRVYGARLRG